MGIKVGPIGEPFGDDCACYDPGETPQILYAVVKGIATGTAWDPALHPPPPNGVFQIIQDEFAPCLWRYVGDTVAVGYDAISPLPGVGSHIAVNVLQNGFINAFFGTQVDNCKAKFINNIDAPIGVKYWGGTVWLFELTI